MGSIRLQLSLFLFLGMVLVTVPLQAQGSGLTGTVKDTTGAVIPGVTVNLIHKGTNITRTAVSGDNGTYVFQQLDPGNYRLEAALAGFKTHITDPVEVPVGVTVTLNLVMELGDITEEVMVEAAATGINTTDASLGNVITGTQVLNLPSESLDPAGLLSLQPGVTFVPGQADLVGGYSGISDFDGRGGSVNGARSDQTNITLDGVDVNDPQNGYAFTSALRATQASVQEFRVTTSNYNPELGRSSAAQVQLVTKSGTNQFHGMAYYTHRNEAVGANDFFNNMDGVEKGKLRRHIYGFALGGPIKKDRLFFFANFERLEHLEAATILRAVPSRSFRDGVLIYQCVAGADCPGGTVAGLTGTHTVPAGFFGLTPAQLAAIDPLGIGPNRAVVEYARLFPEPNATGTFDGINIAGFRFNAPIDNDFKTYIARLDFNIDALGNHTLFARGTLQDDAIVSAGPQFPGRPPNQLMLGNSRGVAVGYKAVLSPTTINTLRWGLTRIGEEFSGIRNSEFVNLRFIDELNGFDSASRNTRGRRLPQHHVRNDTSIISGNHTFSFGFDFRFTRNDRFTNANSFHDFIVNPSWLPNVGRNVTPGAAECVTPGCSAVPGVASGFRAAYRDSVINLLGIITQVNGNYNFLRDGSTQGTGEFVRRRFRVDEYEGYFQDQWRFTPNLTLTAGIRYVLSSPPWETNGLQVVPTPNLGEWFQTRRTLMKNGVPTNQAPQLSFDLAGPANDGRHFYDWDFNNWSPRLALAWAPTATDGFLGWLAGGGKLVIRGGWSLVYDRVGNGLATSFDQNGSFGMSTSITSTFGGCDEGFGTAPLGVCPRFSGPTDTSAARNTLLPAAPPGGFPATPPGADAFGALQPGAFAISQALDSDIVTPYAHTFNISIARDLPGNFTLEAAYVGRRGRNLLISRDLAMPADLCDPKSGSCYFKAAQELIGLFEKGTNIADVRPIAYWENFFPSFGPNGINGGALACGVAPGSDPSASYSATQVAYDWINCVHPDTTVFPWALDVFGFPGYAFCANGRDVDGDGLPDCPFAMFDDQFATLNAWSSIARSEYHAFQLSLRRRFNRGLGFDLNYTLSHSLDHSSAPERAPVSFGFFTGGYTGSTINAWEPDLEYGNSDFDMRHQFNGNWYAELPFGRGRRFGSGIEPWLDQLIGGWQLSGIVRINSGLPANVINARVWPTNWNLQGNATCSPVVPDPEHSVQVAPCPATQNVKNAVDAGGKGRGPNLFAQPEEAFKRFRFTLPGQRGERNVLRADKYFSLDLAVAKQFSLPMEGHILKFRWEAFNVTNSAYFDAVSLSASIGRQGTFGNYTSVMGAPRRMQVSLRWEF